MDRIDECSEEERRVFLGLTDDRGPSPGLTEFQQHLVGIVDDYRKKLPDDEFLRSVGIKP